MGLLGGGDSSGDGLIFTIAITCTVISLVVTFLVGGLLPTAVDYDWDEVNNAREELSNFTGESMISNTPWKLTGVYTPWMLGMDYDGHITDEGYLYGEALTQSSDPEEEGYYPDIGKTANIKLDADQKSSIPLAYGNTTGEVTTMTKKWWANIPVVGWIAQQLGRTDLYHVGSETREFNVWNYTGYRYEFDPMLPFKYGDDAQASAVDGKLSIVWYSNRTIGEGISGGLVIYGQDNVLLAQIDAADIISSYNTMNAYSTRYRFDFYGTDIYLNIRFDANVLSGGTDLQTAWTNGDWTIGITSPSAGTFLDVKNSTSFAGTLGNMWQTFKDIFTFNLPNIDSGYWNAILWILVSFPAELAILLFSTKLGIAGIPAAILANGLILGG